VLDLRKPIERRLTGGQIHQYTVMLLLGQYMHVVVDQQGIDLVISLYGPDGTKIVEMDRWSDTQGPEMLSHIATVSGSYRLEVRSAESRVPTGRYQVTLDELRSAITEDQARVAAEKAYADGDSLFNEGTAESRLKAGEKLEDSLRLWRTLRDRLWTATTLLYLGLIHYDFGDTEKALSYYSEALPEWRAVGDRFGEAATISSIGRAYDSFGEYQKAIDYYERALPMTRGAKQSVWEAYTLHNLGMVYTSLGEYEKALTYYGQAIRLNRNVKDRGAEAHILHHIGEVYILADELPKATAYLNKALSLSRA
jgi:tetratricopeptide (TPR) repeat protein